MLRKTLASAAALAVVLVPLGAATAHAVRSPYAARTAWPAFDYRGCPALSALPAGADPARWRCEVHVASGTVTIGSVGPVRIAITAMTHAEGPLPDGTTGQVFGGLRARTEPVPGVPLLGVRPESGGSADFLTPGGIINLNFRLTGPLVGRHCRLGPVPIALAVVPGSPVWVSQDPPIRRFEGTDTSFAVPAARGCGRLTPLIDRRFGLPSPSGANRLALTAFYSYRTYAQLQTTTVASP